MAALKSYGGAEVFAKFVSEATEGKLQVQPQVQPFAAGEIVGALQAADAVGSRRRGG